jgi:hypothetical protein
MPPRTRLAPRTIPERNEPSQRLAGPCNDDVLACQCPIEQRRQFGLCLGDIDLDGHHVTTFCNAGNKNKGTDAQAR